MSTVAGSIAQLPKNMRNRIVVSEAGCWEWQGCILQCGYGQVRICGTRAYTHRVSYLTLVGPIADGLQLDHLCRNRACANPSHLEAVTPKVNSERRPDAMKTECIRGHSLENAKLRTPARYPHLVVRECRECRNYRQSVYRQRKQAAA